MNQISWNLRLSTTPKCPKTLFIGWLNVINCIDEGEGERWKAMHTDATATLVQCSLS